MKICSTSLDIRKANKDFGIPHLPITVAKIKADGKKGW
jgi:hypothetical protein